ncbi:MAG: DUF4369 domain-containing protein [Flavobacteriaceae bacterium]|nr:DUF4369 domain-containing protein [Flavobacteriaceae bacterium]
MKKIAIVFLALIGLYSCGDDTPQMNLSGEIEGLKKGTLLLQKMEDTTLVSVDSVQVDGSSNFEVSAPIESPEMMYLYVRLENGTLIDEKVAFFAEAGEMTLKTSLNNLAVDAEITGSINNEKLQEYDKIIERYNNKNLDFIEATLKAELEGNDSLANAYEERQRSLIVSKYLATVNFAMNNNDHEVAPYLALSEIYDANIQYLDSVYAKLTPRIKDSKYGVELQDFISERKKDQLEH